MKKSPMRLKDREVLVSKIARGVEADNLKVITKAIEKNKDYKTARVYHLDVLRLKDKKSELIRQIQEKEEKIRNLVERQIGDFETHTFPGSKAGNDIGDDFTELVRKSKEGQPGGAEYMINQNLLDLRYVADNYEDLLDLGEI